MKTHKKRIPSTARQSEARSKIDSQIFDLRAQKKNAILFKDFDTAEKIDKKIETLNISYEESTTLEDQENYSEKIENLISSFEPKLEKLKEEKSTAEHEIRERINNIFEERKRTHFQQIIDLEREKAETQMRERTRGFLDYELLLAQSMHAATIGNYEEARRLQAEAEEIQVKEMKARIERINEEYKKIEENLANSQKNEIELLSRRLENDLKVSASIFANKEKTIQENRSAAIIALFNSKGKGKTNYEAITVNECMKKGIPVPQGLGTSFAVKTKMLTPRKKKIST